MLLILPNLLKTGCNPVLLRISKYTSAVQPRQTRFVKETLNRKSAFGNRKCLNIANQ
jgi:hypothetical protein